MSDSRSKALLPAGLRDYLPPYAAYEAEVVWRLLSCFAGHGYQQVKPPLIEFEDSLFAGSAEAPSQTFRVMDPLSQRMMGLRSDMTPQVARIAAIRLRDAPRPLRLSYSGQVLRIKGSQLRPQRQFGQAGIELIGSNAAAADAEVIALAAEALSLLGLMGITVDLTLPRLVPAILSAQEPDARRLSRLRSALDRKDAAAVAELAGGAADILGVLLDVAGPAPAVLDALAGLDLPPEAAAERERLSDVVALIRTRAPGLALTIDPVENRNFEYHTGVSFTLFAPGEQGELGRGGRYVAGDGEPATGFTLFMDTVLRALPGPRRPRRIYVPPGTSPDTMAALRGEGWVTVAGLEAVADPAAEARRLDCGHVWTAGGAVSVTRKDEG